MESSIWKKTLNSGFVHTLKFAYSSVIVSGCGLQTIREHVLSALEKIISEKKTPERMLNTSAHFHQISQNVSSGIFATFDVNEPDSDQQVPEKITET